MSITNLDFCNALFRHMPPGAASTIHSFVGDPSKDGRWGAQPWWPGKRMASLNPFANNYVCVSSFHSSAEGKFYRRKILFAALHCVMIDDLGTKLPMSDLKLEPSALIETSPGNFQAWLFLDKPIYRVNLAERLINQMVAKGISAALDPGMRGVTRVARLPVGANGKEKYRVGQDIWQQRVTSFDLDRVYTPEQIAQAYDLDLTARPEPPPRSAPLSGIPSEYLRVLKWMKTLGHFNETVRPGYHEIVCPWLHTHSDNAATGSYYTEPEALNSWKGGFMCHHGHCAERDISDLLGWLRAQKEMLEAGDTPFAFGDGIDDGGELE